MISEWMMGSATEMEIGGEIERLRAMIETKIGEIAGLKEDIRALGRLRRMRFGLVALPEEVDDCRIDAAALAAEASQRLIELTAEMERSARSLRDGAAALLQLNCRHDWQWLDEDSRRCRICGKMERDGEILTADFH